MEKITRISDVPTRTITFTTTVGEVGFSMEAFAGGMLLVTATGTNGAIVISFHTKVNGLSNTSFAVFDGTNAAVTMTVQPNRAYPLPDALYGCTWVTATTASSTVTCMIVAKS